MSVAKVTLNGTSLMDTTGVTVDEDNLLSGFTALDNTGTLIEGEATGGSSGYTATMTGTGDASQCYIEIGGTKYYSAGSLSYNGGESVTICGYRIVIDGVVMYDDMDWYDTYAWTLPSADISSIDFIYSNSGPAVVGTVTIVTKDEAVDLNGIIDGGIKGSYTNENVRSVKSYAFYYCTRLSEVSFPQTSTIGSFAFYGCSILSSVSFPQATTIGSYAFAYCPSLLTASFPQATTIGSSAFYGCIRLSEVSFPQATTIWPNAFTNCNALTEVNFPLATSIGGSAFQGCSILSSVSFPQVISIENYAFNSCSSLSAINFPLATSIGTYAFRYCSNLLEVSFPLARSIGTYAFYSCSNLLEVSFPLVTSIGNSAFYNCRALSSVYFPLCSLVASYAFASCYSLAEAYFPSAASIYPYAFQGCSALTIISFPKAMNIQGAAFSGCISLSSAKFLNVMTIGLSAFQNCRELRTAVFSNSSTTLTGTISQSAFINCFNLLSLYLLGSWKMWTLAAGNVFSSTPISNYTVSTGGVYGSIFVPATFYDAYLSSTNWAAYSDRFVSITNQDIYETFPVSANMSALTNGSNMDDQTLGPFMHDGIFVEGMSYYASITYHHNDTDVDYLYNGNFTWSGFPSTYIQLTQSGSTATVNMYFDSDAQIRILGSPKWWLNDPYSIVITTIT